MKGLIIVKEERCHWLRELIPVSHPAMIPLCNKPLLEYMLEFAILCGADKVRFVFDAPDDRIEDYFSTGNRWGVEISYGSIRERDQLEDILSKNSGFCTGDSLLIMDGFFFTRFDKNSDYSDILKNVRGTRELSCSTGEALYRLEDGLPAILKTMEESDLSVHPIETIGDIFNLSMNILSEDATRYVLPGYNNEAGVFIGRNVTIPKTAKITKPVLLGNNVQLGKNCVIGPGAVIGNNVIVDSGSHISRAIIQDNTYIGSDLTFKEKIVQGKIAISAESGKAVEIVDQHLLSGIRGTTGLKPFSLLVHWCLSLLLFVVTILPATLLRLFLRKGGTWQQEETSILLADGSALAVSANRLKNTSIVAKVARGLAMDKVFLLPKVLSGALDLVGNKPIPASPEGKILYDDFSNYLPGIFYFSEAENIDDGDFQEEITERFFSANRSLVSDIKVIFKTILNRW